MKFNLNKRPGTVLGLNFAAGRLVAVVVTRTPGGVEPGPATAVALPPDLLQADAAAVGAAIRRHLDSAGLNERRCVVALPVAWIMSHQAKTPALSPADLAGLLELEAEKGFPCAADELQVAQSPARAGEATFVTQLAVRREQLDRLAAVLKAAGLRPLSLTLGLAALPGAVPPAGAGRITVAATASSATFLLAAGGGIAALRTIEATGADGKVDAVTVARELRITVEQVPAEWRPALAGLWLGGGAAAVAALAPATAGWAAAAGLTVTPAPEAGRSLDEEVAAAVAARWLAGPPGALEFLPPQPNRWAAWFARYNSRRLASAGFAVGGAVVLALASFGWQQYRLWSLRSAWRGMQAQVTRLQAMQDRIHDYRPWFDTSFHHLSILRRVTDCFPDSGSVTAKSIEIRAGSVVSIAGTARDNAALLATLDQLRKTREVRGLKIEQIHGKSPLQFTFSFRWNPLSGS